MTLVADWYLAPLAARGGVGSIASTFLLALGAVAGIGETLQGLEMSMGRIVVIVSGDEGGG